jgi:predicted nucleotidyltransferase
MFKFNRLPDDILSRLPAAESYLHSHPKVLFAYLFGSLVRGFRQPLSDVDIAVYLENYENFSKTKLEILESLADVLQTDEIDLVILNTASLPLAMNILRENRILVDKQPFTRHIVESLTMRKYFDFSMKESAQLRRRYLDG